VGETPRGRGASEGAPVGAMVPVEQRQVILMDGDEVLAARVEPDGIYLPLRPICDSLGIGYSAQFNRLKRDEVLAEGLRRLKIKTAGGTQTMQCLDLEGVPLWLAMIEPSRVHEDLREKLRVYKRWVRKRVWEAFAQETGLMPAHSTTDVTETDDTIRALEQIREMGFAIARMAEQQIVHERRLGTVEGRVMGLDRRIAVVEELSARTDARVDRAAEIMGGTLREIKAVRARLSPGNLITDEQAAEVQEMVKAIAFEMTRRQSAAASGKLNPFAALFGELHRRFRVTSYRNIPVERYPDVIAWLRSYQEALDRDDKGGTPSLQ